MISLLRLEYGIYILLTELFIGSKGYLFYYELGGFNISIRITLWLIVLAVWLIHAIKSYENHRFVPQILQKKIQIKFLNKIFSKFITVKTDKNKAKNSLNFFKSQFFPYYLALFIFITLGVINGIINKNSFNNIFFDINGWLYFLLILPIYAGLNSKKTNLNTLYKIFIASLIWLATKTFFLLFIFSHNMTSIISEVYKWVRVTGVGEITKMPYSESFYRIFFQSHIYPLIGFFIFLLLLNKNLRFKIQDSKFIKLLCLACLMFSSVLISFSRSFWVGLIAGLFLYFCVIIWQHGWKKLISSFGILTVLLLISLSLIIGTIKFPYPKPMGDFNAAQIFSERATKITGEAAVSSRWNLLPELNKAIFKNPVLGQGFGTTITYITSDPRVLETSATGEYTTYAFEWGWLDIWLKLGFFGLLTYVLLIEKILRTSFLYIKNNIDEKENNIILGLLIGLVMLVCVNVFTPYLNHPLGIGYLILVSVVIDKYLKLKS